MSSCPPPPPIPCPQVCPPPCPPPPCLVKPIMKGLLAAKIKGILAKTLFLTVLSGSFYYIFYGMPRIAKYKEYYAKGEFDDWGDEMARKGLFQSVPKESLKKN